MMADSGPWLERPAVSDLVFDYKSGRTRDGWPLEHVKAGSLRALTRYFAFYCTRSARPALVGPDAARLGCDTDFPSIYATMLPAFDGIERMMGELRAYTTEAAAARDVLGLIQCADGLACIMHPEKRHILRLDSTRMADAVALAVDILHDLDGAMRALLGASLPSHLRSAFVDAIAQCQEAHRLAEIALSVVCERGMTVAATETDTLAALRAVTAPEHLRADAVAAVQHVRVDMAAAYDGLWSAPADVLACAWTHVEAQYFRAVPAHEWLSCGWDRSRYEHVCDHIRAAIDFFNAASLWVTTEVLSYDTPEDRAACIVRFTRVATALRAFNVFPALVELSLGLRREPVARLGRTWALVPAHVRARLNEVFAVTDDARNYAAYKAALRGVAAGVPILPHMGAHTAEMTVRDQLMPMTHSTPDGRELIHFRRHRELFDMSMTVIAMQQTDWDAALPHARMPQLINLFMSSLRPFFFVFDEDRDAAIDKLEKRSEAVEPSAAPGEK